MLPDRRKRYTTLFTETDPSRPSQPNRIARTSVLDISFHTSQRPVILFSFSLLRKSYSFTLCSVQSLLVVRKPPLCRDSSVTCRRMARGRRGREIIQERRYPQSHESLPYRRETLAKTKKCEKAREEIAVESWEMSAKRRMENTFPRRRCASCASIQNRTTRLTLGGSRITATPRLLSL